MCGCTALPARRRSIVSSATNVSGSSRSVVGPPFVQVREFSRRVHSDACVEVDTCRYSVPWRLIGETVTVLVVDGEVRIEAAGEQVACHAQTTLRRSAVIDRSHLSGVVGAHCAGVTWLPRQTPAQPVAPLTGELLRPLTEYEAALGGTW